MGLRQLRLAENQRQVANQLLTQRTAVPVELAHQQAAELGFVTEREGTAQHSAHVGGVKAPGVEGDAVAWGVIAARLVCFVAACEARGVLVEAAEELELGDLTEFAIQAELGEEADVGTYVFAP